MLQWFMPKQTVLLIDGDNIPPGSFPSILDAVCLNRRPRIARVFISKMHQRWHDIAAETGLELVIVPTPIPGKNAVDFAMGLDAAFLASQKSLGIFVLVSSDSDFAPLAHRLRAHGKHVHGIGAEHTNLAFRSACTRFTSLTTIWAGSGAKIPKGERFRRLTAAKKKIVRCIPLLKPDRDGWIAIARLETYLRSRDASFDPKNLGYRNMFWLLDSLREVEARNSRVRLRSQPRAGADATMETGHPEHEADIDSQ